MLIFAFFDRIQSNILLTTFSFGLTYGEIDGGCHGGTGGTEYTVEFADDEYITKIQGRSGDSFDRVMYSLTI